MRRQVLEAAAPLLARSALLNTELYFKSQRSGLRIVQVPVAHHPRTAGVRSGARLIPILRAVRDLVWLRLGWRAGGGRHRLPLPKTDEGLSETVVEWRAWRPAEPVAGAADTQRGVAHLARTPVDEMDAASIPGQLGQAIDHLAHTGRLAGADVDHALDSIPQRQQIRSRDVAHVDEIARLPS